MTLLLPPLLQAWPISPLLSEKRYETTQAQQDLLRGLLINCGFGDQRTVELFRKEALDAGTQGWMGTVHLRTTRLAWPLALGTGALAASLLAFLFLGQYTRAEHVHGHLVPAGGLLMLAAPTSGTAVAVLVTEGATVAAGDALIEIAAERSTRESGDVGSVVAAELVRQQARLLDELDRIEAEAERRLQQAERRRQHLERRLASASAEVEIRQDQQRSASELLERVRPMWSSRQLTAIQFQQFEAAVRDADAQLQLAARHRMDAAQAIDELDDEIAEIPHEAAAAKHTIERSLAEVSQARARNQGESAILLRAPRAGIVSGLTVTAGQSVAAGQSLMALIPEGAPLVAELWVPADAIGRVEADGRVRLRYDAFPYQHYGSQFGQVVEVAHRALKPEEIRLATGMDVNAPAYRVVVAPDRQSVSTESGERALRASMTLRAALLLERRRLIELLRA